uniref:Adenylate kinase 8 n=1 Tax=Xenopus tropicalis TaxID=8364 RepID=F7E2P6_XENTR
MDATRKPLRIPPAMALYAEEQGVFDIIQKMVKKVLVDRPKDPIQYMIDHLSNDNDDVPRVFILGPPASGKHTMAKLLCKRLNATHLTPESVLSSDVSLLAKEAQSYRDKGQEVPDELWAKLMQQRLSKVDCIKRGWILEGFPKTREQALKLQMAGICPDHLVVLDAPDIVLIERNMGKRIDTANGEVYHTTFDWPSDPTVQRNLVEPEGISEEETGLRLIEYHRNIPGILRTYPKTSKKINADQPYMDVFSQVLTFVLSKPRSLAPHTPRILLYGPPGSGRSLQASLLAQKYGIVNICCGQVLKEAVADQTKLGEVIQPYIENDQQGGNSFFLRFLTNLNPTSFNKSPSEDFHLVALPAVTDRVFSLDLSDDVVIERLSLCMTDPVSGERYHDIYKPAPSSEVHERLQQNPRHSEQRVQARLDMYHANAEELDEFYPDVIHINADQDPYTVFEFIESYTVSPLPRPLPEEPTSP